jgi:hypothetical protein
MKYLGKKPGRCDCRYCTGDNNSKSVHKAIKHGDRQEVKKEIKDELQLHNPSRGRKKETS